MSLQSASYIINVARLEICYNFLIDDVIAQKIAAQWIWGLKVNVKMIHSANLRNFK